MDPVIITAVKAKATEIAEGTKVVGEASEAIIGEQGLVGQLEAIENRTPSIYQVDAR